MTHRERVLTALSGGEPDRVPIDIGASVNNMNDGVYKKVRDLLGFDDSAEQFRGLMTATYYDERVFEALETDIRHLWLNDPVEYRAITDKSFNPRNYTDDWGVQVIREEGKGAFHTDAVMATASVEDLKNYSWPDTSHPVRTIGLKERAEALHARGEYAVGANIVGHGGLLDHGTYLRGTEQFFMDLLIEKDFANALLDKIMEVFLGLYKTLLDVAGPYLDIVYWAEDFGSQTSLLISEELYVEFFKERHRQIFDYIRSRAPKAKILFHSCGAIFPLIKHIAEIGVDILNPLQPLATGMDSALIKQEFGGHLSFCGAIDIQKALPGTKEEVEAEVKTRIAQLAPGGGYILAPANYIQDNTPAENVIHLVNSVKKYGKYPISISI